MSLVDVASIIFRWKLNQRWGSIVTSNEIQVQRNRPQQPSGFPEADLFGNLSQLLGLTDPNITENACDTIMQRKLISCNN